MVRIQLPPGLPAGPLRTPERHCGALQGVPCTLPLYTSSTTKLQGVGLGAAYPEGGRHPRASSAVPGHEPGAVQANDDNEIRPGGGAGKEFQWAATCLLWPHFAHGTSPRNHGTSLSSQKPTADGVSLRINAEAMQGTVRYVVYSRGINRFKRTSGSSC